jgi:hypothetical protein
VAEAAGAHLGLGDAEQLDDGVGAEPVAWVDRPAAVFDLLAARGPLGPGDHGAHAGQRLPLAPAPAGDLIRQGEDLAADHGPRHQVGDAWEFLQRCTLSSW